MKINRIYIKNFGSISGGEYNLSKGLNVVFGQNESGKSTFLSFLRFIFYGAKKGSKKETEFFDKYMPWNGEDMSGEIEFTFNGVDYFLSRSISSTGRRKDVSLINKTTGDSIPVEWNEVGAKFFNLSEQAFLKTLFLDAEGAIIPGDDELLSKISNVAQSGDENVSYQAVRKEINEMIADIISTRKHNAILPDIEKQLTEATAKKAQAEQLMERRSMLAERMAAVEENLKAAIAEKSRLSDLSAKRKQYADYVAYEKAAAKLKEAEEAYRNADYDISGSGEKYDFLKSISPQEEQLILKDNSARLLELKMQAMNTQDKVKLFSALAAVAAVLALICAIIGAFYPIAFAGGAAFAAAVVFFIISSKRHKKRKNDLDVEISKAEESKAEILNKYKLESAEQYQMLKREYNDSLARDELRKSKLAMAKDIYQERKSEFDSLSAAITARYGSTDSLECAEITIDEAILSEQMRMADEKILSFTAERAGLQSDTESAEGVSDDLAELNSEIESLNIAREEAEKRLHTLNLAAELLDVSYEELKSNFAPKLARATADIFKAVTGGKYGELIVNDKFEIKIKSDGKFENSKFFSSGTIQQLYFSLRLGIIELIMGSYPLFIDDAFITYDDERFDNAARFLKDYSESNQIIFCTCHQREGNMSGAEVLKF